MSFAVAFTVALLAASFDLDLVRGGPSGSGSSLRKLGKRAAQASPTAAPYYVCVPAGTCVSNAIDSRAASPSICSFGQVPCYDGSTAPLCGLRYVNSSNTADGPTTLGAHPWQAYIVNETKFTGSGALLDQYHVLTIAHKVSANVNTPSNVRVFMGVWDPTDMSGAASFTVARIIVHPNFAPDTLKNDIAVLRLSSPVTLGNQVSVGAVCLGRSSFTYVGRNCVVAGWGQTQFGANDAPTRTQRQITVPIVDYSTCRTALAQATRLGGNVDRYLDPSSEVCAGGNAQVDACTQDGGSPLVCQGSTTPRFFLVGLVTWGLRCGQPGVYGVYTYVPYYEDWINQTIANLNAG